MSKTSWVITLEEDPETGDLILPLSDEIMDSAGWKLGDVLEWVDNKDGTWVLRKYQEHDKSYYDTDRNR